jgi:hypothetical protein
VAGARASTPSQLQRPEYTQRRLDAHLELSNHFPGGGQLDQKELLYSQTVGGQKSQRHSLSRRK